MLGSHECRFDKLENFAITFWKKPTFTSHLEAENPFGLVDLQFWNDWKAKNISMAVFVVFWPYLLTTKLSCLQKNNFEHTNTYVSYFQHWDSPIVYTN